MQESFKKIKDFIRDRMWRAGLDGYWQLMRDYDDICQETFLRSFEILHKYHGKCRFASWVAKISFYFISRRIRDIKRNKED